MLVLLTPAKVKMFSNDLVIIRRFLARVTATYSKFHSSSENDSEESKGKTSINSIKKPRQESMFSSKCLLPPLPLPWKRNNSTFTMYTKFSYKYQLQK